jgi:AcrR family transcriptional regulator
MQRATHEPDHSDHVDAISASRQRILDIAEAMYMQHGYHAVSLREIAQAVSLRQASLYYHFPEGKEQLFQAVAERAFLRHQAGIECAILAQGVDLRRQLLALIEWFDSQPEINLTAMVHTDMPALHPERMQALEQAAHRALFQPILTMFAQAIQRRDIRPVNPGMLAGMMLSIISGLRYGSRQIEATARPAMIEEMVDVLLNGLIKGV